MCIRDRPTDCPESETHETKNCCAQIPCRLCISLIPAYTDVEFFSEATFDKDFNEYRGTIETGSGTHDFTFAWDRDESSDNCQHVVTLDGVEVLRVDNCECLDISGEVDTAAGLLTYSRQVQHIRKHWDKTCDTSCIDCRCAADTICATYELSLIHI